MRNPKTLRSFAEDRRGNIGPMMALMVVPVLGITSMAIDLGRAMNARTTVQAAVDIAALAGVRSPTATETERIAAAQAAFSANLGIQNADPVNLTPTITYTNGTMTVSASGSVKTTLAQLLGLANLSYVAESTASIASGKKLELSMMIDLTGSMGEYRNGQTKIAGLKQAADDMLSILFPNNATTSDNVRVAVTPFADYVNAGSYADEATGLSATGGTYTPISNLSSTRQGKTSHVRYTGYTGNSMGSQCGATSASGILSAAGGSTPSSINSSGGTFNNAYCATPTYSHTANVYKTGSSGYEWGQKVTVLGLNYNCNYYGNNCSNAYYSGDIPGFKKASSGAQMYDIDKWDGSWQDNGRYSSGYFVPLLNDDAGLTQTEYTHDYCSDYYNFGATTGSCYSWIRNKKGKVGVSVSYTSSSSTSQVVKRASDMAEGGYWRITQIATTGSSGTTGYAFVYYWTTSGRFIPVYDSLSSSGTYAGCESTSVAPSSSNKLISCVTEREGNEAYTDAAPTTSTVGAFNHGNNGIDNYSSDGKCWVAGRELPSIIPLTNDKATLTSFFTNATVGGATPGHIGTAWSWYMLSPKWSSVFPSASTPAAYGSANVMKVAVLMTDGEYNIHYATATAREQALALCTNMKAAGITIYTVGFGFSASSTAGDATAEGQAKDLLTKCASDNNKYFFPYDGAAMRTAFQNIGNSLMGALTTTTSKLTN